MKKIVALILARGGSKGIPGKNIKILKGEPLLAYTIKEAKKSGYLDRIILSTDDQKIADAGEKRGVEVPFIRPEKLATDEAKSIDSVIHALSWLAKQENYYPDYTMLLQPTSPLRTVEDINKAVEKFNKEKGDSLISVCETDTHPYWMIEIENGEAVPFVNDSQKKYNRRQELPKVYSKNGAIYLAKTSLLRKQKTLTPGTTIPYIMPKERSVDIDDRLDWKFAEALLEEETR